MNWICFNGRFVNEQEVEIPFDHTAPGNGRMIFETMVVEQRSILHADYHFDRLFQGMNKLGIASSNFTITQFIKEIAELCERNGHQPRARVRLSVFPSGSDSNCDAPIYIIQSFELSQPLSSLPKEGLQVAFYSEGYKAINTTSNLKTNNELLYKTALRYARDKGLDDVLISNSRNQVIESTIANIWWISGNIIYTPPLADGCVNGVMRRMLLQELSPKLANVGLSIEEKSTTQEALLQADEVFLSNAVRGLLWVEKIEQQAFPYDKFSLIFELLSA